MEVRRLVAMVCTILIPTWVSEPVLNRQIIGGINKKMRSSSEGDKPKVVVFKDDFIILVIFYQIQFYQYRDNKNIA